MSDEMAFTGTLTGIKHMKMTGDMRIEITVDSSMANAVFERIGGFPKAGESRAVAVAVMKDDEQ